nr:MAG TPA: hypothetical protein [Caudoviricetes sp.]
MTEIKFYKCDFCGKEYDTQEEAAWCEESHEKDIEISSRVYISRCYNGMPSEINVENKEHTKVATYKIADVREKAIACQQD